MNGDWLAVFETLRSVYTDGAYSNMAVSEALSRHKGCRESFVRNFAKGVLRDTVRLDYFIDRLASRGIGRIKTRPLIVIRMGMYAIESLGSVPDHAAVNESVNLARRVARGTEGFVNGILRAYIRSRDALVIPGDRTDIRYSVSPAIVSLMRDQYGDETESILAGLRTPPAINIRVNRLKTTRSDVIDRLRADGISAEPSGDSPNAVTAEGSGIISSSLHRNGEISVQSISSMMAIEALNPAPGSEVLDMCAAPGGKSAYMAELMDNRGSITACDIHEHRLALIDSTAARLGVDIIHSALMDGTVHDGRLDGSFDFVLCDVPCSGLGVMGSKPEITFTSDPAKYAELIQIQRAVLGNAIRYARKGGRIEYSTCTLNKDENEGVIESILGDGADSLLSVIEMKTLMPYNNKVGFFYCILEKNAD